VMMSKYIPYGASKQSDAFGKSHFVSAIGLLLIILKFE
jgi:hypothetical protein